jgi:hypothetical protein
LGGSFVLGMSGNSPLKLLESVFPEFKWLPWKFTRSSKNVFDDPINEKLFMEHAKKELKINSMEDWYKVTLNVNKNPE